MLEMLRLESFLDQANANPNAIGLLSTESCSGFSHSYACSKAWQRRLKAYAAPGNWGQHDSEPAYDQRLSIKPTLNSVLRVMNTGRDR